MEHPDLETLGALVEDRVPVEQRVALEAHLASCPECRGAASAAIAASELGRFAAPLSPELAARLRALPCPSTPAAPRKRRPSGRSPRPSAASSIAWVLVALGALGVAAFTLLRAPEPAPLPAPSPSPAPAPSPPPAPSPVPTAAPVPSPSPSPSPAPDPVPAPAPVPVPVPAPDVTAKAPPPPPAPTPLPAPAPAEVARVESSVQLTLAAGSLAVAKHPLKVGETFAARPSDDLVASGPGARLSLAAGDLYLKAGSTALLEAPDRARLKSGEALAERGVALACGDFTARGFKVGALQEHNDVVFYSLVDDARIDDASSSIKLAANREIVAYRGAKLGALRAHITRGAGRWADGVAPRERLLYRADFEKDADGWDEEVRVQPGFGGSGSALEAVPSAPGQPWYFLALRTKFALDAKTAVVRFRFKTPVPGDTLRVIVTLRGVSGSFVLELVPRTSEWTFVEARLASMKHEDGALPDASLGDDRSAKIVVQQGEDRDPVKCAFRIDDFEVLAVLR